MSITSAKFWDFSFVDFFVLYHAVEQHNKKWTLS